MTDYARATNFTALAGLDSIPSIFDTEFNLVATASATKADKLNPTFSGTVIIPAIGAVTSDAGNILKTSPAQSGEIYMHTFATGVKAPFYQATAPTGWTQDVTNNDAILRVVSAGGGGAGGTAGLVTAPLAITDGHVLTIAEMPAHTHTIPFIQFSQTGFSAGSPMTSSGTTTSSATGGDGAHTHTITWAPKYIDVIVCTKD